MEDVTKVTEGAVRATAPRSVWVVVSASALVLSLLLAFTGTRAAFTGTTSNAGNAWDTGRVSLSNNRAAAMFEASGMVPGDVVSNSITVTNDSAVPSVDVRLYGTSLVDADGLGAKLNLSIGTTAGGTEIYSGTVAGFAATKTNFTTGADSWDGVAPTATRTYYFRVELDAATSDTFENKVTELTFVWEAQSNATQV